MDSNYDAIVIGSGLGGLTAGALFAKQGKRVLVLERHLKFGGAATGFNRKGLRIEVGLHEIDGLDDKDIKAGLIDTLGLKDSLEFIPTQSLYEVRHPSLGEGFVMPEGMAEAISAAITRFPAHKKAIRRYFRTLKRIRTTTANYLNSNRTLLWWLVNGPIFPLRFWSILRYEQTTLGQFLDKLFDDDEAVKFALAGNFPYYSDDINKLSLLFYASAQASYHEGGSYFIRGGAQKLSDRLVSIIREAGGDAQTRRSVSRILMAGNQAIGVEHEKAMVIAKMAPVKNKDLQTAYAPVIFGNAAPNVLRDMLPTEQQQRFFNPHQDKNTSNSLWTIYLGLKQDPANFGARQYSTFIYSDWADSMQKTKQASRIMGHQPGNKMPGFAFVNYNMLDSSLTDEGYYLAEMCGFDHLDNWYHLSEAEYERHKEQWLEALLVELEQAFPGIGDSIVYKEMATARTVKDYLNTPNGAVYGYAQEPEQSGRRRPHSKTSVKGLWLASAFASPGGGFTGAMRAGEEAVRSVNKA